MSRENSVLAFACAVGGGGAVKWYRSNGKRFYVIEVTGSTINPRSASAAHYPKTTYAVLDRDWNHREVGVFGARPGSVEENARVKAHALADKLNAEDSCIS